MLPHQPFPAPKRLKTSLKRRVYPRHHFIPRTTPRHCTSLQDRMLPGRKGTGTMALRKDDSLRIGVDLGGTKIEFVTLEIHTNAQGIIFSKSHRACPLSTGEHSI